MIKTMNNRGNFKRIFIENIIRMIKTMNNRGNCNRTPLKLTFTNRRQGKRR